MLGRLRLKTKIQLLPALAGIAFIALIIINISRGSENTGRLEEIERGHFPALEASRELVVTLEETRRTFQDATTAQDADALGKAREHTTKFGKSLDDLEHAGVVDTTSVGALRTAYTAYVERAERAARKIIASSSSTPIEEPGGVGARGHTDNGVADPDAAGHVGAGVVGAGSGQSGSGVEPRATTASKNVTPVLPAPIATAEPVSTEELEALAESYKSLQTSVNAVSEAQRARMATAFIAARQTSVDATRANIGIGVVCLVLLVVVSVWTMRSVVATLAEASGFVSAAAAEILAVARQTEANAADEAAFVDETRRAMDGLVESASAISASASAVLERAELSANASRTIAGRISELNSQALKITDVSDVIRGIADKSDILALNASLEGSRAGEAGRGFALVGAEMRRLAETVVDAVRQIKVLANDIREVSQAAVLATEEGQKIAAETTQTSRQISLITSQQRTATEQVTQSVDEIQQFTRQAVNGAKQSRAAAADLLRTTSQLNVLLTGKSGAADIEKSVAASREAAP